MRHGSLPWLSPQSRSIVARWSPVEWLWRRGPAGDRPLPDGFGSATNDKRGLANAAAGILPGTARTNSASLGHIEQNFAQRLCAAHALNGFTRAREWACRAGS